MQCAYYNIQQFNDLLYLLFAGNRNYGNLFQTSCSIKLTSITILISITIANWIKYSKTQRRAFTNSCCYITDRTLLIAITVRCTSFHTFCFFYSNTFRFSFTDWYTYRWPRTYREGTRIYVLCIG
jgi:hypothetical protein